MPLNNKSSCSTANFHMVVKEDQKKRFVWRRWRLKMEFGLVLILFFGLMVLCVFYYSLVNISKQSAIKEKKLLNKNWYKKRNSREFLFCFTCNKAGSTRTIAPKESIYKKGWDEIWTNTVYLIFLKLSWKNVNVFSFQNIDVIKNSKNKISNVRDF